jgi:hypothetical protein
VAGSGNYEHTHEGNLSTSLSRKAIGLMKKEIVETSATPSAVIGSVSSRLEDHILMALPNRSRLSLKLQRYKKKALEDDDDGMMLSPPPTDTHFDIPERFTQLILHDSGIDGGERILILGCQELLDGLARAKLWLADGTFKVVPSIFYQLYTIHFELTPGNNPAAVYCLIKNKQRST